MMIQWHQYAPEGAKAIYKIPFEDIDPSRQEYAILTIQKLRSKARVKHPCFVPIEFANTVIKLARQSNRNCPFLNHESLWKQITNFARQEYHVKLTSHYLRKRFYNIAQRTAMPENHWVYLMGEKLKQGHLPQVYSLRFLDDLRLCENQHLR